MPKTLHSSRPPPASFVCWRCPRRDAPRRRLSAIVERQQSAGHRPTLLARTVGGERQQTGVVNSKDGKRAASSPDWLSGTDPEETPTDLTSPPRSGQSHPYSGPAEGDASARSTARNCGYDRRKPSGIRSTQGDRSLTLSRSRSRGCAGTGAWAPMPGGRPLTVSGTVGAVDHAFVREAAALEPAARGAAVTWRVSALFRPAAGAVEAAAAA